MLWFKKKKKKGLSGHRTNFQIQFSLEFVPNTVTASCVLHNICQVHNEYFDHAWQVGANEDNQFCSLQQELDQEINIDEVDINRAKAI